MEFAQTELVAVAAVTKETVELVKELNDLELSLVGGGQGDVAFG